MYITIDVYVYVEIYFVAWKDYDLVSKYANGFVVLCVVWVTFYFPVYSQDGFTHVTQGCIDQ